MKCCGSVKQDKHSIQSSAAKGRAAQKKGTHVNYNAKDSFVAPYRTRVRTAFGYTTVV